MQDKIGFCKEYIDLFKLTKSNEIDRATEYKIKYLKSLIVNNKIYKFIGFDNDSYCNRRKIDTICNKQIWFSAPYKLNDGDEAQIIYDSEYISNITSRKKEYIDFYVPYLYQLYDIYSATYVYEDDMWDKYANSGYGICIEYDIHNYDFFYPVEYTNKRDFDFNLMIINALLGKSLELAIVPWIIKNPYNYYANLDSTEEKEIRILYDPYGNKELNNGIIFPRLKKDIGYSGIAKTYTDFGMDISKIIIGDKCPDRYIDSVATFANTNNLNICNRNDL